MRVGYKYSWAEIETLMQQWKSFAEGHGGTFTTNPNAREGIPDVMHFEAMIPFSGGLITFTTTEINPLKIRFVFNNSTATEFLIYPEDFTDRLGKLFGMKEVQLGDPDFDKRYFIKCRNEGFIKNMLTTEVKSMLLQHLIANFKLENIDEQALLELNIAINELEMSKMEVLYKLFMGIVATVINEEVL